MTTRSTLVTLALASLLASQAAAQRTRPQPPSTNPPAAPSTNPAATNPAATQPGTVAAPTPKDEPSPYLTLSRPRNWTLTTRVRLNAPTEWRDSEHKNLPILHGFHFESAAIVYPLMTKTGTCNRNIDEPIVSSVRLDDRVVAETFAERPGYPAGENLGVWTMKETHGRQIYLEVKLPVTCYETTYDEKKASEVKWPTGAWPADAQSCFLPQLGVDWGWDVDGSRREYEMKVIDDLVKDWTGGKDPKSIPPATLAKWLAGNVQELVTISGKGMNWSRTGELEGFDIKGSVGTALDKRGSVFDVSLLLTAVYRRAGLPARVVIAYQAKEDDDDFLSKSRRSDDLYAWVEFALWDESTQTLTWVPVDIARMRGSGARMRPLDQPWRYFGTSDKFDEFTPISHHFFPPTTVRSYNSPALWGWLVIPEPPGKAEQTVYFGSSSTPVRVKPPGR